MRCLVICEDDEILRFPVPAAEARLGSDPSNDLVVPFRGVSRFHARLVPDIVAPRLIDLDSRNGLVVSGRRLSEVVLLPGLAVLAGHARITLEDAATSELELAVEFPRSPIACHVSRSEGDFATDSVEPTETPGEAIRLLRDLTRCRPDGSSGAEAAGFLEQLLRVLDARSVALFQRGPAGLEILSEAGAPLDRSLVSTLSDGRRSGGTMWFPDGSGAEGAFRETGPSTGRAAVVLPTMGKHFYPWQKDLIHVCLDELTGSPLPTRSTPAEPVERASLLVFPEGMIPGSSAAMRGLLGQIGKTVRSRANVLVSGETGTGKELIARMIHASGPTACGPFMAINCSAIPSELLESELFGVRARVATGVDPQQGRIVEADGGTLLLDEIGEMPLALQPKLLRFLQEREVHSLGASRPQRVNVRVVSISNRDLLEESRAGRFRADLYYRLRGLQFHVPPLRDRKEDLADLVTAFASQASREEERSVRGVSRKALELLSEYDWPGNVRELQSEVRRAVLFCPQGGTLSSEHFKPILWAIGQRKASGGAGKASATSMAPAAWVRSAGDTLKDHVTALERRLIREALDQVNGNKAAAARRLGLTRAGLSMKLRRLFAS